MYKAVISVCLTAFLGAVTFGVVNGYAIQLNSKDAPGELDAVIEQHCQIAQSDCEKIPQSPLLSVYSENGAKGFNDTEANLKLFCCQMKASNSNQFILEFILSDLNYSKTDEAENWSVVSGAADEGEIEIGIQNEIDLLEVEELETPAETEEAEADDLTEPSIEEKPAIEYDYSRLFFFNREVDSGRVLFPSEHGLGFSAAELKLDLFSVLNQSVCQLLKKYDEGDSGYVIPEIPVYTNKKIQAFIHLYTQKKRDVFVKAIERMPLYQEFITKTLVEHELPLNLAYLAVVESNLNPNARSRANAVGLWQFMSYTGKHFGLSNSWWHDDRYDPERSTEAAAKYLKKLHQQFEGNWELAMAAYNSGSGTVRKAIRRAKAQRKSSDFWSLRLPRETRGYVPAFYAVATIFANLDAYGFVPLQPALVTESKQLLDVGGGISLGQLAKVFDLEQERLAEINPRLRFRGLTPPTVESFHVALPLSFEITPDHLEQLENLKKNRHEEWKVHTVKQGETLWSISRRYRIPLETILDYNRLRKKSLISIGQKLMLPIPTDWDPPKSRSQVQLTAADMDKIPGITRIHVVQKGETLWQISQKYNIPIKTIQYWNQAILNSRYLKIGTEIVLKLPVSYASNSI